MLTVLGGLAEFERELIRARTGEGRKRAKESGVRKIYAPEAVELLATADWPGNIRQLHNVVRQNVALSQTPIIPVELVQQSLGGFAFSAGTRS